MKRLKKNELGDRRRQIADLALKGWTQQAIAAQVGICQGTVARHLDQIRLEWRNSAVRDFDEARDRELQKLALVESEAWAAWQRSQAPAQAAMLSEGKDGKLSRSSLRHQYGDPRFLDQINKCITQRCILLGLQHAAPPWRNRPMDTFHSKFAANEFSDSSLNCATENELASLERDLMTASPAALALTTSRGKWRMARHLMWLDQALLAAIDDAAAGLLDGLVVCMPPQHGKSELCSKYLPAWYLGTFPDRRVLLTGYEHDFASQWGRRARDLLIEWGHLFGVRVSSKSSAIHRWDLEGRAGGMMTAGVAGPITGKGTHLLIIDDPIKNDAEARNAFHRQKQFDWWQSTASTRLRPGGLTLVIQTRWHRDDLAGRILSEAKTTGARWRELKLPALAEDRDPLQRAPGEPLWPEMYSLEHPQRIRERQTNYFWRSLYQQDPIAEGSTEWPDSFFGPSIWFDEWPADSLCRAMALDPSKGRETTKFGDYSAFVMLQLQQGGPIYIDADLEVRNVSLIAEQAVHLMNTFRPHGFGVETNQFQELLAGEIGRLARPLKLNTEIYHVDNTTPKLVRIRQLTSHLAHGHFRFKRNSRGAKLLVQQLRDFPHGEHDDGPDALEMALRVMHACFEPSEPDFEMQRAVTW